MSELPNGWTIASGNDLFEFVTSGSRGWAKYYADSGDIFVRIGNLERGTTKIQLNNLQYVSLPPNVEGVRTKLSIGDILVSITADLGIIAEVDDTLSGDAYVNQHIALVRPIDRGLTPYIARYLLSPVGQAEIGAANRGVTRAGLGLNDIRNLSIPLAPKQEQCRIITKLDSLRARTYRARAELDLIPKQIERYKQAILARAFSGELTKDWREAHAIDESKPHLLSSVAVGFSYGSSAKSAKQGRVPVLRMGNIQNGRLDWQDLVYTTDQAEIEKYRLQRGDVLFNRTNSPELVGKTALFDDDREAIYAGYLIRIRCGDKLMPTYLTYCLNSPQGRAYCWQVKSDGVSQSNINAKKLGAFELL
ncbi:MAG: restriction endonuclease subunit S, partial [Pseudomonadota bacterium]